MQTFRVLTEKGAVELALGMPVNRLLGGSTKSVSVAIVSAFNPGGLAAEGVANARADAWLRAAIETKRYRAMKVESRTSCGFEIGYALLDVPLAEASRLARDFGQTAVFFANEGEPLQRIALS